MQALTGTRETVPSCLRRKLPFTESRQLPNFASIPLKKESVLRAAHPRNPPTEQVLGHPSHRQRRAARTHRGGCATWQISPENEHEECSVLYYNDLRMYRAWAL
ncbi:hypothetical protein NDU88_006209 [Pleurodeles waltl]|uniref:Uncharacterized protein n=1 Tax=Pleurodeles waltl TaxID=8319 RepID=A0AAV7N075_PLEWA|nr:hypothetical protein NDU88_006209 [Pleurodeles waltl]